MIQQLCSWILLTLFENIATQHFVYKLYKSSPYSLKKTEKKWINKL